MRPTTTQQATTTQEPTGRYQVGPEMGETTFPGAPPSLSNALTSQLPWGTEPEGSYGPGIPPYLPEPQEFGPSLGAGPVPQRPPVTMGGYPGAFGFGGPYDQPYDTLNLGASTYPGLAETRVQPPPEGYGISPWMAQGPSEVEVPPERPAAPPPGPAPMTGPRREPIPHVPVLGPETAPVTRMETVTKPGRELLDVIAQNPQMLEVLKAYPGLLPLIAQEREAQQWKGIFDQSAPPMRGQGGPAIAEQSASQGIQGVPGEVPTEAPAVAEDPQVASLRAARMRLEPVVQQIIGTPMAATERGAKIIDQYQKLVTAEDAAMTRAAQARKAGREERTAAREETRAEQATQFVENEAARLEASDNPADHQLARTLRAASADPKLADAMQKHYEQQQKAADKAAEIEKPILIEGQPYRVARNAQGEPVMQPIAGVPQKAAKSWYEGITRAEAEAMSKDPALPPERRQQARELADALQTGAEKVQAAGVLPPPKATVASDEKAGERVIMMRGLDQVADIVRRNPDFVGGSAKPLTAGKWATAYETWDPLKGVAARAAQIPPEYDTFRANLGMFTAEKLHEMSGAALTPAEIKRYGAFLPSPWQSPERFQAGLLVSRQMLIGASQFYEARQAGKSIPEAQKIARDAIEQAYQEGVKQYGDPSSATPKPKTARAFWKNKEGAGATP